MKTAAFVLAGVLAAGGSHAQSLPPARSVWVNDYSAESVPSLVAAGNSTLIYGVGSSMEIANHVAVARYVAQRVAEELVTALVLPIRPMPQPSGGSRAQSDRDRVTAAFETVNEAIRSGGFRYVVIIADEGVGPDDRTGMQLADRLNGQWQADGVRVIYVTAHEERPGQGMSFNADYLRRWGSSTIPPERRKAVEDEAELLYADAQQAWFRPDMIPVEDRAVVGPALGRLLLEQRVSSVLNQIRSVSPAHLR